VHDRTWKQVYWPDFACTWYPSALRAARELLAGGRYDALISVSHPFTGHLVGEKLKGANPALRWLVDVGDPFAFIEGTPTNNARLYGGLNHRAERRVLRRADTVAVTTAGTLSRYAEAFPESAGKVVVVPPLLSIPPRQEEGAPFFPPAPGVLRLVYAGTLHPRLRTPERLLSLFRALLDGPPGERLELHFVGPLNGCDADFAPYAALMGRRVFLHGMVPRDAAFRAMDEADVLVNLGNRSGYQLPSKVVEYAASGRPVLNLAGAPDDTTVEFFDTYPAALQLPHDAVADAGTVRRVAEFLQRAPAADAESVERCLAPYRVEAVAAGYERLLRCG
jgi:glycosyltransferase involved in cell wall biosynthesis